MAASVSWGLTNGFLKVDQQGNVESKIDNLRNGVKMVNIPEPNSSPDVTYHELNVKIMLHCSTSVGKSAQADVGNCV